MRVFITGITGTLGTALARLHHARGDQVLGCARGAAGVARWLRTHGRLGTALVADADDLAEPYTDLGRLLPTLDRVYHCAALKHVDICERQPDEGWRQNLLLAERVAGACADARVALVVVSTDKACLPRCVYGATKLLAEAAGLRHGAAVVRLGNLLGSSGSVLETWRQAAAAGRPLVVNDPEATRYWMTPGQGAEFVAMYAVPGRVAVPEPLRATRLLDLAEAVGRHVGVAHGCPRPGDVRHQWLLAPGDRVERRPGCLLLRGAGASQVEGGGDVSVLADGLCSEWALRWDAGELLALLAAEEGRV